MISSIDMEKFENQKMFMAKLSSKKIEKEDNILLGKE